MMKLIKSLIIAVVLSIIGLTSWEMFWRSQGIYPTIDGNDALWAVVRNKVDNLTKDDVILMGSSRVHFDIQLDEWQKITGKRPIQLASGGCSPLPFFHDIVNNSNFTGIVLVGVTPGLFFSTTNPKTQPWERPQSKVDHFHNRTYAQRLNHQLSLPLQRSLTFLNDDDGVDGMRLKALLKKVKIDDRVINPMPPFHNFSVISEDRNVRMKRRMETDTAYANTVKAVWSFFMSGDGSPPDKDATMAFFLEDLQKFKAKGGQVILVRCPSNDKYRDTETKVTPRETFWDELISQANVNAYHFEDYDQLQNLNIPEWSHLSAGDADFFTTELLKIMINDNALTNHKIN